MSLDNINIICLVLGCVPLINIIYLIKIGLQVVIYSCVIPSLFVCGPVGHDPNH